eukprot:SAG25_NODE_702_length_5870_cov_4.999653_4_plen_102_part_00
MPRTVLAAASVAALAVSALLPNVSARRGAAGDTSASCEAAMVEACGGQPHGQACDVCVAHNQHLLRLAGCSELDVTAYCMGSCVIAGGPVAHGCQLYCHCS